MSNAERILKIAGNCLTFLAEFLTMVAATSDGLSPVTGTLTTEERILTEREAGPDNNRMSPLSDNQPFNPSS